ncbi:hypothetical protein B296_00048037 [Ensete ventricosum]|uniref:Uncharacterized protein n=1 Tax=Ensete ventricosum TaxID=4639 RepID=A0A426Y5L9_ENSVE|nr:hypothetical protein B296_00048037 [Ensete ventricosum]
MSLQPHVFLTSRPYPEGRLRIVIPKSTPGTNRPSSPRTPEGASIHIKFRPQPMLTDLSTRTKIGQADTSARLLKVS